MNTKCEYKCDLCIELFPSSTELTKHKRISHIEAIGESQIKCRDCGKSFTEHKNMVRHMKEVHRYTFANLDYAPIDSDIVLCMECDETFLRETNLKRHIETVHDSQKSSKLIKCPSC